MLTLNSHHRADNRLQALRFRHFWRFAWRRAQLQVDAVFLAEFANYILYCDLHSLYAIDEIVSDFEHIEAFAEGAKSAEVNDIRHDEVGLGGFTQVDELVEGRIAETEN